MSVIGGLLLSAFGGLLVVAGIRRLFTAVSVYRNEAIPVRRVAKSEGIVEFDGRVEPLAGEGTFEAPFSGEEALCCEVWMETKRRHRTDTEGLEIGNSKKPDNYRNTESSWLLAETDDIRRPFAVVEGGTRVTVDPDGAALDITGHMGETVLTVEGGDPLPAKVRARLDTLDGAEDEFDGSVKIWDREGDHVKYREARLEPGTPVHVAGATVEHVPDEWGSATDATVSGSDTDRRYLISEGIESDVVRKHFVQFITGTILGSGLLAVGLHALEIVTVL